jgi:Glycosyl hydrolase catalytic core
MAKSVDLPLVTPVHSDRVAKSYGVCGHVNFNTTVWGETEEWLQRFDSLGATYFRSMYPHQMASNDTAIAEARRLGLKWLATVAPEDWSLSDAEITTRLAHIKNNAADVVFAIEGVNEPNQARSGGTLEADWADRTVHVQQLIWNYVQANMPQIDVIGPSLHATVSTVHEDHVTLGNKGIQNYYDYAGLHRYSGGRYPNYLSDERIGWIRQEWSATKPIWVTETGYTNCVNNTTQHKPVPESVSAAYGPLSVLEWFVRGCKSTRYEGLDDPNPGKDVVESNFGLWRTPSLTPSTWTEKPEVAKMRDFLSSLSDPGVAYTPAGIKMKLAYNTTPTLARSLLVGKRNGTKTLLLWQTAPIFNPTTQVALKPPAVTVTIQRPTRSWSVSVPAGTVVSVPIV